ncbi:hypothetical protein Xvie_00621 [Xenorhabdus vietnamensis]|uniref:Phage membrane protein n=1 Tax=Xenorhabdus vietnamensis TaxID=351656 RepID=A0A1Y2SK38_9GAMM|nr:hypothetical protein [Xenorhabdus vietnamensis]OTA17943.1 hypothetical protein Xvie_00621 [Xenorhabdus vietnamensis]
MKDKYYFDGMYVDKTELIFWLILDEFRKQFTVVDVVAIASMLASLPVLDAPGKAGGGATKGTSPLSVASRKLIRHKFKTRRKTITWGQLLKGKWAYTTSLATFVGRWLPWVGAVLTAYTLAIITRNVIHRYKLIVGSGGNH